MRSLCTSLGSWDTIEGERRHGVTFPLAIVGAVMEAEGFEPPRSWEGDAEDGGAVTARDYDLLLISAMDSRHFWRVPGWLRQIGVAPRWAERDEADPIVVVGGQAATAPAPIERFVDVVYIGEAEAHLGDLLRCLSSGRAAGWSRDRILDAAACVPGCLVPRHRPHWHSVEQVYADDISITLNNRLWVNHRKIHRVEIARGCQSKCGFCALGWRSRYRENGAEAIVEALEGTQSMGVREVHLSAGDAEAHSGIVQIRDAVRSGGMRDYGWTGRMDTVRDCSVSAGKYFAFGLEGASHRLRAAVGKPRLTDEYIISSMSQYWQVGGRRVMWHLIGGLPGTTPQDVQAYEALLDGTRRAASELGVELRLDIGRQPFGPLPHTPMQWFGPGIETSELGQAVRPYLRDPVLRVTDKAGQSVRAALLNTLVMRGGEEVSDLLEHGYPRLSEAPIVARRQFRDLCRRWGLDRSRYIGEWDPDDPTPWEHVRSAYDVSSLRRAYARIRERLGMD